MSSRVVVVGCGVVGAAIAYELSQSTTLDITVLDQQFPAQGATGAALGLLMGVISHKVKGRAWRLRESSLRRYQTLLPELEAITGWRIPRNDQGILSLCFDETALTRWCSLQAIRHQQGWPLEIWSQQRMQDHCPHLAINTGKTAIAAGIYSPADRQINPKALTLALVEAAQQRGVAFHFEAPVTGFQRSSEQVAAVQTEARAYPTDWVVLTAGLGSEHLMSQLGQSFPLVPVLGQGIRLRMDKTLGVADFQPVINGEDVHLVPMGDRQYAIAATVEFPEDQGVTPSPRTQALDKIWQTALTYCPALAQAEVIDTWYGLRPRPEGQAAPVVKPLETYTNVIAATGHYRNGVLLAPATAELVKALLR